MTNMKPKGGASIEAPSLRGLQGRSATGLNGQAAKEEVSALWRGGWMPENISGVPAGRSVFHLTSPFIGLLARHNFRLARHTTRIALSSGHALHLHLPWSSPNTTTLLSRGNSYMRTSIAP